MKDSNPRISCDVLLVDDEDDLRIQIAQNLRRLGYRVTEAGCLADAVETLKTCEIPLALVDLVLPDGSGADLLDQLQSAGQDDCAVVMLSGQGTITTAVEAMKRGAADFLTKPVRLQELDAALQRVLEHRRLKRENQQLRELLRLKQSDHRIVGESVPMQEIFRLIARVAPTDNPVLIQGESGTGKELVALALAEASPLKDRPFVTINCAALPESLLESELFGHEKGAFTGAQSAKPGLFEVADGGTLFIDEVGELAASLQAKLLRVLEDGSLRRVGSIKQRKVQVRLLAATNRDLAEEVRAGRFREDLFYRINVLTFTLPPLRDRGSDLTLLLQHFCGPGWQLEDGLAERLMRYRWPGNIRQLRNVIERAKILATGHVIELANFPPEVIAATHHADPVTDADADRDLEQANRRHILTAYEQANRNKTLAARNLGVTRRTLYRLLEKYDIQ